MVLARQMAVCTSPISAAIGTALQLARTMGSPTSTSYRTPDVRRAYEFRRAQAHRRMENTMYASTPARAEDASMCAALFGGGPDPSIAPDRRDGNRSESASESALAFFLDRISGPIVQAKRVNCHVEGGVSGHARLIFQSPSNADHAALNLAAIEKGHSSPWDDPQYGRRGDRVHYGFGRAPLELIAHVVENDFSYTEVLTADYFMANPEASEAYGASVRFDDPKDPTEFRPSEILSYYRDDESKSIPTDGDYRIEVVAYQQAAGGDSAMPEMAVESDVHTSRGARAIRRKLVELHQKLLGVAVTVDSPEVDAAFRLFVDAWGRKRRTGD